MGSLSSGLSIGVIYSLLLLISTEECSWIQKMTKRDVKMVVGHWILSTFTLRPSVFVTILACHSHNLFNMIPDRTGCRIF